MVDTIGMGQWNINLLKSNVIDEVRYRLDNLDDLESLKENANKGQWQTLKNTMVATCENFANAVKKH
jgi:hypothetical protein